MSFRKTRIAMVSALVVAGVIASLVIRHQNQAKLRERQEELDQQNTRLATLSAEYHRLSNLVTRARESGDHLPSRDYTAELEKLRSEAEALRKQTNELGRQAAEARRARPLPNISMPDPHGPGHSSFVVSDSDSDEYKEQLYRIGAASPHSGPFNIDARKDAQNLAHSVRTYALEHQGEIPSGFDVAAPYLFKEHYRIPNAGEYEIVYHGSMNHLTNIPQQAVALVREREPWPTPAGKLGRIYVMANGFVKIVESSDNFQSWEAEHIIPPSDRR